MLRAPSPPAFVPTVDVREIREWQQIVFALAHLDGDQGLTIQGPTVDAISDTLLQLLAFHFPNDAAEVRMFFPVPGVLCDIQDIVTFIQPTVEIHMCVEFCLNSCRHAHFLD
jgi:hypothetical protein